MSHARRDGKDGMPTWGHLEYIDHGADVKVHGTSITGYLREGPDGTDSRPTGTRLICGKARTNLNDDVVDFFVRVRDAGEPGDMDQFDITLLQGVVPFYTTFIPSGPHLLSGGNIQLHTLSTTTFNFNCPGV